MITENTQVETTTQKVVETQSAAPATKTNRVVAKRTANKVVATTPAATLTKSAKSVKAPKAAVAPKAPVKPKAAKPVKEKKPKLVRDSFTIPKAEYTVLDDLKARANNLASPAKKSELLRAGIKALAAMSDAAFQVALRAVPVIKTGRPAKE